MYIAHLLEHPGCALREELLHPFLGVDSDDTDNKLCELLALTGRQEGLGICNQMSTPEEFYSKSLDVNCYLVETLAVQEEFNHVQHMSQVAKAQMSARKVTALHECNILELGSQGKLVDRRCCKQGLNGTGTFLTTIPPPKYQHPLCRGISG